MKKIIGLLFLLFFTVLSCAAKSSIVFPCGKKKAVMGGDVVSDYEGVVVKSPKKLPDECKDCCVLETSTPYYFDGKECTSKYQVIYYDITQTAKKGEKIQKGDKLGTANTSIAKIIVRSTELDPYLVSVSNVMPVQYEGYFYFYPGMLLYTTMKYLIYEPVNIDNVKWMYDHTTNPNTTTDDDWAPGLSVFNWKILVETTLSEYPSILNEEVYFENILFESQMIIEYEGMKFSLGFYKGFRDYLLDEYKLGDKIYLYLDIDSIDAFDKTFNCYVRDFSLESPTEIVKKDIKLIKEELNKK